MPSVSASALSALRLTDRQEALSSKPRPATRVVLKQSEPVAKIVTRNSDPARFLPEPPTSGSLFASTGLMALALALAPALTPAPTPRFRLPVAA